MHPQLLDALADRLGIAEIAVGDAQQSIENARSTSKIPQRGQPIVEFNRLPNLMYLSFI
jgi:hypothetical protein